MQQHQRPGLRSTILVESIREVKRNRTAEKRLSSSLSSDAERIGECIRFHWDVENQLHWAFDAIFNEDSSQISKDCFCAKHVSN
ncbi:MAG: hypothetical protein AAGF04_04140 [Chlamydiota bacterium]